MNVPDVPDDIYEALALAAAANRQSLSAFIIDRLTEAAQVARMPEYLASYPPPEGTRVSLQDTVAAVREVRRAS